MTTRSLVGMTQGARKRAWLAGSIDATVFPDGINTDELEMKSAYSWSEIRRWWQPFGWQLLGQRLRPCPGCHACMPGVKGWHIDKVRGRFKMPTVAWNCDGSGVLPARAKKVRR